MDKQKSQHDNAWADSANNLRFVQNLNKEEYEKILNDKNSYNYWINKAREELVNKAELEEKYLYAEITIDNLKEIHEQAEKLVTNYLVSEKKLVEGTDEFRQEFNNIITDNQYDNLNSANILTLLEDKLSKAVINDESVENPLEELGQTSISITEEDLIDISQFYEAVAEQMVEEMADNPMTLDEESGKQL